MGVLIINLRLMVLVLLFAGIEIGCAGIAQTNKGVATPEALCNMLPNGTSDISVLICQMRTDDAQIRSRISDRLLQTADQSPDEKVLVQRELLATAAKCGEITSSDEYHVWEGSVLTLGKLQTADAIPTLVNCLTSRTSVGSLHLEDYPAFVALRDIGKPALDVARKIAQDRESSDDEHRYLAISLISAISDSGDDVKFLGLLMKRESSSFLRQTEQDAIRKVAQRKTKSDRTKDRAG